MRALVPFLAAVLAASPALATWTEIVGAGGPTSGRLRWAGPTNQPRIAVMQRATTHTNILWTIDGADALGNFSAADYGGSGTDEYYTLTIYSAGSTYAIGGRQENGVSDLAYQGIITIGVGSNVYPLTASTRGAALGYAHGVVTHNSRDRWVLGTDASTLTANARWYGGTALPSTVADDTKTISAGNDVRHNEGCVATETTTPAVFGVTIKTNGTVLVSRLVAAGATNIQTLPSGWGSGDTIQLGQCFMIGTRFVVVADNVTDGNVFVGIVGTTPSFEQTQTISGDVVGGVGLSGTGYIMASDGTLYSSDGTATFADASDDFSGGTPLILALAPAGDALHVWDADGDVSERSVGSAPTVVTDAATAVTRSSATLNATVNPGGLSTTGSFDYGPTTSYGASASAGDLGSGAIDVAASASVTGLLCGRTYHFRGTATNSQDTTNGDDATFQTAPCLPASRSSRSETGQGSSGWDEVGWR